MPSADTPTPALLEKEGFGVGQGDDDDLESSIIEDVPKS
jgi:hypothetical protein